MVSLSSGCRHGGDPANEAAWAVLLDVTGLFVATSALTLHQGGIAVGGAAPSVSMPCWRCAAGPDEALASFAAAWMRHHRHAFGPGGLSREARLWTREGPGSVRLEHDPISLLVAGLRLLDGAAPMDEHGRARQEDDALYSKDLASLPMANLLAEGLLEAADAALRESSAFALAVEPWPPGVPWALSLSHDIDHVRKWRRENRGDRVRDVKRSLVRRRGVLRSTRNLLTSVFRGFGRPDPFQNVLDMARRERERGLRATYFFGIAEPSSSPYEITYTPGELRAAVDFASLQRMGHEVGLHGSYASADSEDGLTRERTTLRTISGAEVRGTRQHYLRFSWGRVHPWQVRAGFEYDSSWGYPQTPGFRGGLGTPFLFGAPHDPASWRVELPMAVMDGSTLRDLFELDPQGAKKILEPMVEASRSVRGLLVVNWHNTAFDREVPRPYAETFDWLVGAAKRHGAAMMTLEEAARWWTLRSRVRVEGLPGQARVSLPKGLPNVGLRVLGKPPAEPPAAVTVSADSSGHTVWIATPGTNRLDVARPR